MCFLTHPVSNGMEDFSEEVFEHRNGNGNKEGGPQPEKAEQLERPELVLLREKRKEIMDRIYRMKSELERMKSSRDKSELPAAIEELSRALEGLEDVVRDEEDLLKGMNN